MTEDRLMVAEAVFKGLIGEEYITQDEVDEFMALVVEAAMDKELEAAAERGLNVFSGFENEKIH